MNACGLIGFNAGNLTGGDSRMKVRLKTLPDELRGGAWPSSARAVRHPVNSGNGRDPHPQLLMDPERGSCKLGRPLPFKAEEGAGDGRSVCPETPGPHAGCNGRDRGIRPREGKAIPKPCRS